MNEITFEKYGQVVRCWVDGTPPRSGSGDARSGIPVWRAEVDGQDRGDFQPVGRLDGSDDVAAAAVEYLEQRGGIRIPPPPWQWSVLDDRGREWWARVTAGTGPLDRRICTLLLWLSGTLLHRAFPLDSGIPPTAAGLRGLLAEFREEPAGPEHDP